MFLVITYLLVFLHDSVKIKLIGAEFIFSRSCNFATFFPELINEFAIFTQVATEDINLTLSIPIPDEEKNLS